MVSGSVYSVGGCDFAMQYQKASSGTNSPVLRVGEQAKSARPQPLFT
jgi:hypothetical protein